MEHYQQIINAMKADFDSAIFGKEKDNSFQSAVGQITVAQGFQKIIP